MFLIGRFGMNRNFVVLLCLMIPAAPLAADTGDALFLQSYSFPDLDKGIQAVSVCDDFIPVVSGNAQFINIWMALLSGQPEHLTIAIEQDGGSINPNFTFYVYSGLVSVVFTDTGDVYSGQPVYKASMVIPSGVSLVAGNRYWLEISLPVGGYWLAQQPLVFGSTMWVFNSDGWIPTDQIVGYEVDSFFEIYMPVSLERNSWASIKSSF